jgi:hypothetical protein
MKTKTLILCAILGACFARSAYCAEANSAAPAAAADYEKVVTARADKIVAPLGITDAAKQTRVRDLVAKHYVDLKAIHDARDARVKAVANDKAADAAAKQREKQGATDAADLKLYHLHYEFVAKLSTELSAEQIEKVKDGLTYGVLPLTYRTYCEMYPQFTDEQKRQILAWLTEAREHAMDAGSSEEKHKWFGKYKGRISNTLSQWGYDAKKAERDFLERQKGASRN